MNTPNTIKHKSKSGRNTIICPLKRARSWCYTWNNHTDEDWHTQHSIFSKCKIAKHICQEEMGKCGTPHIQGFIQFRNAINFSTLKKINKKIHWEVCRNIPASINYCSKVATRSGRSYVFGIVIPEGKNEIKSLEDLDGKSKILDDMRQQMMNEWRSKVDEMMKSVNLSYTGC